MRPVGIVGVYLWESRSASAAVYVTAARRLRAFVALRALFACSAPRIRAKVASARPRHFYFGSKLHIMQFSHSVATAQVYNAPYGCSNGGLALSRWSLKVGDFQLILPKVISPRSSVVVDFR